MTLSMNECGCPEDCYDIQSCNEKVFRSFDISVPVTVTPYAVPEKPDVKCTGKITVTCGHKFCENPDNMFVFTITQGIDITIPVKFGAEVCYGKTCAEGECKMECENAQ